MKKYAMLVLIALITAMLSGCSSSYTDNSKNFLLPDELKDYKVIRLHSDQGSVLYVLVKKQGENRDVIGTTTAGKHPLTTIVLNGETYAKIENNIEK